MSGLSCLLKILLGNMFTDVQGDLSHAKYQSGILLVTIPKRQEDRKISIEVVEE
ncbi:MAG: hypothetical protein HYV41_04860 [Candidatus Magasanikbacteria bacterium]|nr:hypothetical protein [Candidatus Magasanikbacteria bacterium]